MDIMENTTGTLPTLSTLTITEITQTSATGGGNVTSDGGATVTARGICWSTSSNPTISNNPIPCGSGTGSYVCDITGLESNTQYHVRAYATNSVGTSYGDDVLFTTEGVPTGEPCPGVPTVTYGGQTYSTVQIGDQCWLKENLNIGTMIDGSQNQNSSNGTIEKYCYNNDPDNCSEYGGLYQWDEMMQESTTPGIQGFCPNGWHVPTDEEWGVLVSFLGGTTNSGGPLKEEGFVHWQNPNTSATNSTGFTSLGTGSRLSSSPTFQHINLGCSFQTSTENGPSNCWTYRNNHNHGVTYHDGNSLKSYGYPVRCLKN